MRKQNKGKMLKFFKIQLWITTLIFLAYLIVAFGQGENFFVNDLKTKKAVAGSVVTAMIRIFGTPNQPVITIQTGCNNQNNSYIRLDWEIEDDATFYDVCRNGSELAINLVDNFYLDNNVLSGNIYQYSVVARGPAGEATSESFSVRAISCGEPILIPFVRINSFLGKAIDNQGEIIKTEKEKIFFGGVTNIENALIKIEIRGERDIYAETWANQNGFWDWESLVNIPQGFYTVYIRAVSQDNPSIEADCFLSFIIRDKETDEEKDEENIPTYKAIDDYRKSYPEKQKPFDFDLSMENTIYIKGVSVNEEAYRGENLVVNLEFSDVTLENRPMEVTYILIDPSRKVVSEFTERVVLKKNMILEKNIPLGYEFELGRYNLKINATIDKMTIGHEGFFELKDRPILKIGTGAYITYSDIVNNLGWLAIVSTSFLGFFSILAFWEHHLYERGFFHITEKTLRKRGFIR